MYVNIVVGGKNMIQKWPGTVIRETLGRKKRYLLRTDLLFAPGSQVKLVCPDKREFYVELKTLGRDHRAKSYPWVYEIVKSTPQINF